MTDIASLQDSHGTSMQEMAPALAEGRGEALSETMCVNTVRLNAIDTEHQPHGKGCRTISRHTGSPSRIHCVATTRKPARALFQTISKENSYLANSSMNLSENSNPYASFERAEANVMAMLRPFRANLHNVS